MSPKEELPNVFERNMGDRVHLGDFFESSPDDDLKLPENFEVGRAVGGGDCFFDSFKQGIEQQLGIKVTVEQLRKDCQEFAQNNSPEWFTSAIATEWFRSFFKLSRISDRGVVRSEISGYYIREILNSNKWGDPDVEGRILCQKYNVRLHVVKKQSMVAGGWIHQIISVTGSVSRDASNVNYNEENTIYVIKNGDNAHFEPILEVQQSSSSKYGIKRRHKEPKPELIELFLFEAIDKFKQNFNTLLEEIPKKHPVPYDEFFIYFFLGSAIMFPDRLKEKVGIKEIYFNLSLEDKKSIKLIFDVNKDNQRRRLVFRTINVNVIDESGQSNFNKDDQNTFIEKSYSDGDIKEIAKKLCLTDQSVNLPEIDEMSFHLNLTKSERLLEITKDQYVKEALQKIQEEERIKQPSLHGGSEEKFKAVGWQDKEFTKWFRRNGNSKSRFEDALEMLSKEAEEVKKGVEEIFNSFIEVCRGEKNFPQKQRGKNEKKGQSRNDQYKESRFHGFIYGTLMLNFKSLYHLNCYVERFSGMGGGADLVLISRKDEYRNRNLNAVPVMVELKVDKNARDACEQVKSNIVPSVRTFAEKAIIAGVSLLSNEKGSNKKWLPLIVDEHNIPNSEGFITLLLKNVNDSNLSKGIQSKNIQEGLKYLHYLIPGIDRISYPQLGYRHRNYLSRLILGEILASSSELNKLVFIHRDEDVSEKVTTLLLHQNNKNLIVILNIIELNTKDKDENNFKLNKAVPLPSNEANINSVYQINIKIDFRNSDFRNENSKGKSYLQEDIKVEKFDLGKYKSMSKYAGEFKRVGNIDCISLNKEGRLELVKKEYLIDNLNKALFPIKELITGVAGEDELIAKTTNINFLAIIQGLFTGKQNIANEKNHIIKILPKVNIAYKELIDLAISIANKDKSTRENEVVFIYTSKPDTITEYLLNSVTDKMLPKLYLLKFNSKTKDENRLITIDTRGLYIRHNSYNRDNIINDLIDYIVDDDIKGFDDLLKNELNELLKSDTDREHTLESLHNIAATLYDRGGYEWVLRICEEIYKIQKDILIPDHPNALSTRNIMAAVLENQYKYDEALKTYKEVYEGRKKILGEDNFDTLTTWYNTARVLKLQGKYDESLQSYKGVYEIQKDILGYDNPATLATLISIGILLCDYGKYNEALQTLQEVFNIQKKSLDDPNTLNTLIAIAALLKGQGKYKEALQMSNEIFNKITKISETNYRITLKTCNNMALVCSDLGKYEEALKILYAIYRKRNDIFGPHNPETLYTQFSIGLVLCHQDKYSEALEILNKVYERYKKILGPEHLDTLRTHNIIAYVLVKLNKYEEAIQAISINYDVHKRTLGENNFNTLLTLGHMSQVLFKQGEEALEVLQKVLNEEKKVLDNDLNILKTKNCIAQVFSSLGKYKKAFQTYKEVYEKRKDILGSDHHDTLSTWNNMKVMLFNKSIYKYKYEDRVVIQLNIIVAVQRGDKNMVESLIKRGYDVNIQARNKVTPLHLAALEGHIEIIKLLLKNGANIEAGGINDWRPLHYATFFNGCLNTVHSLLEGGANINAANKDNRVPLYYTTDDSIKKVLMSTQELFYAIKQKQNKSKIQELLKNGASVNAVSDTDRSTVLHFAVYNGNIDIVNVLLQNRADAIRVTNEGNTPLHIAALKDYKEIVEALLQHIKQVNPSEMSNFINAQTIVEGTTSLHVAAQNNNKEIIEILLKNGAHYDVKNTQGKIPLDLAKPGSDVKNLLGFIDQLFQTVRDNKKDLVNSLLKGNDSSILKAILNARNIDKKTLIQVAIFNQQKDIAELLIKELIAIQSSDQQKTDPIHQFEVSNKKCLPSASNRKKREAENGCSFMWEDVCSKLSF